MTHIYFFLVVLQTLVIDFELTNNPFYGGYNYFCHVIESWIYFISFLYWYLELSHSVKHYSLLFFVLDYFLYVLTLYNLKGYIGKFIERIPKNNRLNIYAI